MVRFLVYSRVTSYFMLATQSIKLRHISCVIILLVTKPYSTIGSREQWFCSAPGDFSSNLYDKDHLTLERESSGLKGP